MSNRTVDRRVGLAGIAIGLLLLLTGFLSFQSHEYDDYQLPLPPAYEGQ